MEVIKYPEDTILKVVILEQASASPNSIPPMNYKYLLIQIMENANRNDKNKLYSIMHLAILVKEDSIKMR